MTSSFNLALTCKGAEQAQCAGHQSGNEPDSIKGSHWAGSGESVFTTYAARPFRRYTPGASVVVELTPAFWCSIFCHFFCVPYMNSMALSDFRIGEIHHDDKDR